MSNSSVPDSHDAMSEDVSELLNSFSQATANQKLDILNETINSVEDCKPLLFKALNDENLLVRFSSYKHLAELGDGSDAPAEGVRLETGDRIYIVYQSHLSYTDENYEVSQEINLEGEAELEQRVAEIEDEDWEGEGYPDFESYRGMELYDYESQPKRQTWHPLLNEATEIANEYHVKYVWEYECLCEECFYEEQQIIVNAWCQRHNIPIEQYKDEWGHTDIERIGKELHKTENIKLLADLIEVLYGKLAFVYEEVIKTQRHLKLDLSL
jgi:hypothetical protein